MSKDAKSAVLSYLRAQNRPYSTNDVVSNLHNEHGKAHVQRALDLLVADGDVVEKINGKQKAYVVNQESMPSASDAELAKLDSDAASAREGADAKRKAADRAEGHLRGVVSLPITKELLKENLALESEVSSLEAKLESLSKRGNLVSKEEVKKVEKAREDAVQVWRKRRRMCLGVTDAILESYPKSRKVLFDDVGIETDEDVGVKMPQ